jgi:adenylyl-sulfate kinase
MVNPVRDVTVTAEMITGHQAAEVSLAIAVPMRHITESATIWLTGLSGVGKSTIANLLADRFRGKGAKVEVLDGDALRTTLCKGLGFSRGDREENIRRIAFLCELLNRHDVMTIVAAISPYRTGREEARKKIPKFIEVYLTCPLEVLIKRDTKGLYQRALTGQIPNFTGVSDPYEPPLAPDLTIDTSQESSTEAVERVIDKLIELGLIRTSESS